MGLRLHWRRFPDEFRSTVEHLIDPAAPGSFDDMLPLVEEQIRAGFSHLRPWVACGRQIEAAAVEVEAEVRDFIKDVYEKARTLGWSSGEDLQAWMARRSGLVDGFEEEPQSRPEPTLRGDWA